MTEPTQPRWRRGWMPRLSDNLQGMLLMVASTACMATMYVAVREVPGGMHPFEIAFFRNVAGLLVLLAWHRGGIVACYRTQHVRLHLLRGALNVVAMLMFFYAVLITPLADVAALGFTAPLFASVLAIFVLRERLRWHRIAVIAFGFLGALTILRPGLVAIQIGPMLLLGSAAIWAVTMMVIKVLARTDSSVTITVYMGSVMAPLALVAAAFHWQWPSAEQLAWLLLIGVLGTVGQISLAQSFRLAEVSAVLPLDFLKLVWSSLLGFVIFAESPDLFTWLGGTMIFSSTTYLALREARSPAPRAAPIVQPAVPR